MAAGASSELVVDASGVVSFGADDVESSEFEDFLGFFLGLLFVFVEGFDPFGVVVGAVFFGGESEGFHFLEGGGFGVASEDDVGASAGHVGGYGDGAFFAGVGDDLCFAFVVFGVEDFVFDSFLFEEVGELFGFFDAGGADEDGLSGLGALLDVVDDGVEFGLFVFVDEVFVVDALFGFVVGDDGDSHVVGVGEFCCFGFGGAGHA